MVAASRITPEAIDFLMNRGSGIIYVTVEGGGLEKLQSPFMCFSDCHFPSYDKEQIDEVNTHLVRYVQQMYSSLIDYIEGIKKQLY
ncbi:hypothetical protein SOVF_056800 isoform A [Spinacia oleracea]|nr:hypothetical protein SOVF_056800 isoform A [Spinacia oleracea]